MNDLDKITTLEEAKQQISLLLESHKTVYSFVHNLCNYDIKTPLLGLKSYTKSMQEGKEKPNSSSLKFMMNIEQKIHRLIDIVRDVVDIESAKTRNDYQEFVRKIYPLETIKLDKVLVEGMSHMQNFVDSENDLTIWSQQFHEEHKIPTQIQEPVQIKTSLADDLPEIQFNSTLLSEITSDIIFSITNEHKSITNVFLLTSYDEQWVKIIYGCFTSIPNKYVLDEFQKLKTSPTIFEISTMSLFLYKSWYWLNMFNGKLLLEIQDSTSIHEPSMASVTICLKR